MFYQTVHHKRILGGYVPREAPESRRLIREHRLLRFLDGLPDSRQSSVCGFGPSGEFVHRRVPGERLRASSREEIDRLGREKGALLEERASFRELFQEHRIRFIVVHKVLYRSEILDILEELLGELATRKAFEDASLLAYELY